MNSRIRIAALLAATVFLSSCAPTTYTVMVDKKIVPEHAVDFGKKLPGIVTVTPRESQDSLLISSFAIGMAEQLESDLYLSPGSIPVYYLYSQDIDLNDPGMMEGLVRQTGTDIMLIVDSVSIGEFSVNRPVEMAFHGNEFLKQTVVSLPFSMDIRVFMADSSYTDRMHVEETSEWTMLSEEDLSNVRAVGEINKKLENSFKENGSSIAKEFVSHWETVNTRLYVYDNSRWWDACRHAYLFEWEDAMEIWMEEAKSNDVMKAACASYNVSVACRMLEMKDLAWEWKNKADNLMGHDSSLQ